MRGEEGRWEALRTAGICLGCLLGFKLLEKAAHAVLPTVSAGQQILATDHNNVVSLLNTHDTTLATHTSQITALQSATSGLNSAATDSHITSDGNGNLTVSNSVAVTNAASGYKINGVDVLTAGSGGTTWLQAPGIIKFGISGVQAHIDNTGGCTLRGTLTQNGSP